MEPEALTKRHNHSLTGEEWQLIAVIMAGVAIWLWVKT